MSAAGRQGQESPDAQTRTLGALLYADPSKVPVSEAEWVALVRAIAAGDQRALQALYERTSRIVFTVIMRITSNRETAEELTVDVFRDVWRCAPTYDPDRGPVVGWIMNQARSRAIDRVRFEHRKKRVNGSGHGPEPLMTAPGPHEAADLRQQDTLLREALALLTPDERQAIETAFFSELTYSETAAELKQPLGTVKTRIRTGLGKLRQALGGKLGAS